MFDNFKNSISGINTAHQLALGATLGMMIGLLPKDSVFPYALVLVLLCTRGNLLCGLLSAIAFSLISPNLDSISHAAGLRFLTAESLQTSLANLSNQTWASWTRFNNTVVTGSLIVGLISAIPFYLIVRSFFTRVGLRLLQKIANHPSVSWLRNEPTTQDDILAID